LTRELKLTQQELDEARRFAESVERSYRGKNAKPKLSRNDRTERNHFVRKCGEIVLARYTKGKIPEFNRYREWRPGKPLPGIFEAPEPLVVLPVKV